MIPKRVKGTFLGGCRAHQHGCMKPVGKTRHSSRFPPLPLKCLLLDMPAGVPVEQVFTFAEQTTYAFRLMIVSP